MPGKEPKGGIRYESLVAAALKSLDFQEGGLALNLTSFNFNVNPQTFVASLTGIGFDVTVDAIATGDGPQFFVECKSSKTPGEVVRIGSEDFLKAMIEFVALQNFSEKYKWQFRYLLVTNVDFGKDIVDLFEKTQTKQLKNLRDRLRDYGAHKKPNTKTNMKIISTDLVRRTINATTIVTLTDQFLREKYLSDKVFKDWCDSFSAKLRAPRSDLLPTRGVVISQNHPRIVFLCKAETHESCKESLHKGFVCHIGKALEFADEIMTAYKKAGSPICRLIRSKELDYSPSDVVVEKTASLKDVADALSDALGNLLKHTNVAFTLAIAPGTYDIAIAKRARLAKLVRSSYDPPSDKYDLDKIRELNGLGAILKISLAKQAMLQEYEIMTSPEDYLTKEGIE